MDGYREKVKDLRIALARQLGANLHLLQLVLGDGILFSSRDNDILGDLLNAVPELNQVIYSCTELCEFADTQVLDMHGSVLG